MYLKELTINGFKSFAKKGELEFSTSIAAIVGPNGSGKSNVAESFRFVLGEQSVKSMRGKRGEDLIWGGSDAVSRANRASVEVVFDNSSRGINLDFDEVVIERIVHRDGQNEYKINGSTVRLKDVHELLAQAHIGATGHHIISQGEADRVISAGPKERREMIEDALGLKIYQLKKQDAEKKLKKTEANIKETESLRREAAPHLRYLKKQVERAERSLQVQEELTTAYAAYLKREDVYVALRTDQLQADRREPATAQAAALEQITALKSQLAAAAQSVDTSSLDTAEAALRTAQQALREAERALSTQEGQVSYLARKLETPVTTPVQQDELIPRSSVQTLVGEITAEVDTLIKSGDQSKAVGLLGQIIARLSQFIEREEVVVVDTKAADQAALATAQAELPELQETRDKAVVTVTEAETVVTEARAAITTEQTNQHEAERTLFATMDQERQLGQDLRSIDMELQVLERDRAEFKREIQEAVALIGRGAMGYTEFVIVNEAGQTVSDQDILNEDREAQRTRRRELEKLKIRLEELGVGATEDLLQEYEEAKQRDEFLAGELTDLVASVKNLQSLIAEMDQQLHTQFVAGIDTISVEFNRFFTLMFGGGSATLNRVQIKTKGDEDGEESDVVNEGVELSVALPNKRVKGLEMLSGGERALTSIALIFAMSQVNPPPFIILDETDAALDEANSRRYGDMIQALSEKSQLILITHNRETMSRAGILYGITMGADGVSKILSVKFDEAAEHAK